MMGGGVVKGSTTTLIGPSGVGKTLLSLKFLEAGRRNAASVACTSASTSRRSGWSRRPRRCRSGSPTPSTDGRLTIQWQPAVELAIDELAAELIAVVKRTNASRLVVDGIEGFHDSANRVERFGLFLNALTHRLRAIRRHDDAHRGTAALHRRGARRRDARFGDDREYRAAALRRDEFRALPDAAVVKQRESAHDSAIRRFIIDERGLHVTEGFIGGTGLLSGRGSIAPSLSVSDAGTRT